MATVNLFSQPVFRDGALTAADPAGAPLRAAQGDRRDRHRRRARRPDLRLWGGREGVESAAARDRASRSSATAKASSSSASTSALRASRCGRARGKTERAARPPLPADHRPHAALHPDTRAPRDGRRQPGDGHEFNGRTVVLRRRGQALWAGKLFHVDLNSQNGPRYDQDFRFGAEDLKEAFLTVRLLERSGYDGPRHFDARAYRSGDDVDVYAAFARGCIRNYKILAAKAATFDADPRIQEACVNAGTTNIAQTHPHLLSRHTRRTTR